MGLITYGISFLERRLKVESKPVIILGAGGHAKVLIEMLKLKSASILGIIAPDGKLGECNLGQKILGDDANLSKYEPKNYFLVNGIGSVKNLGRRKSVFEKFKTMGFEFSSVIHPSAIIAQGVKIGEGIQIMAGAVIQPGSSIGRNTIINTNATIDHDCVVGDHVHISPGVTLSGIIKIGDCVHVGTGATIIQCVKIGNDCLVGAGSLVTRDVPEQQMVVGVPARLTKTLKDWRKTLVFPTTSIRETLKIIDSEALRLAIVVGENDTLLGIVTDGDLRRGILRNISLEAPVENIMNSHPIVANEYEEAERIISLMKNKSLQQIPVVDNKNRIIRVELLENFVYSRLL